MAEAEPETNNLDPAVTPGGPEGTEGGETQGTDPNAPSGEPTGDEPEGGEGGEPEGGEEGGEPKGEESRANQRIRSLLAENKALREYSEFWQNRAMPKGETEKQPEEKPAPKLKDFDGDTEKWAEAYAQWTDERVEKQAAKVAEQQLSKARESDSKAQQQQRWQERLDEFAKQQTDAMDLISDPSFTQSETMAAVIRHSENGPALAYHLAKNRDENERIKALPTEQQAAELGRIEAKLDTGAQGGSGGKGGKKASSAPQPPNPVKGGGNTSVDLEKCSMEEYLAQRVPGYKPKK